MLGSDALMRLSLVISAPPGASGTLKSTRMKTRLPFRSSSRIERVLMWVHYACSVDTKERSVFFGQFPGLAVAPAEYMGRLAGGQTASVPGPDHFIAEPD